MTPTSKAFEVWNDTSSLPPMYLKIRFFNWTNPEELKMRDKKPNLVEIGPYVFRYDDWPDSNTPIAADLSRNSNR